MEEQEPHQEPVVKRRRVDSDQQSSPPKLERRNNSRIRIPAPCAPAINQITQELGLRSNGEAILWLIEQARPELVPPRQVPLKKLPRVVTNNNGGAVPFPSSSPIPVAFAYPSGGDSVMNGKIMSLVPIENSGSGDSSVTETEVEAEEVLAVTEKTVRATVVQASTVFYDTKATLDKAERLIAGAAAYGSQLVVFPEAFVGGHPRFVYGVFDRSHLADEHSELHKYHAAAIDVPGPEVDRLAEIAKKYKIHIVMGVVEREGLMLYSTLVLFDSQGQCLGKHRKLMPTSSEQMVWQAGNKPNAPVYKTSVGKIGGFICWDNRMPPLRTELYAKGIEIYCAPTADASDAWKASMTHLAVEGGCFVLSANQFCQRKDYPLPESYSVDSDKNLSPDSIVCAGGSVIISPSGAVLAGPNYQGESLISADLDLGEIARAKVEFDVVRHATSLGLIDRHLTPGQLWDSRN